MLLSYISISSLSHTLHHFGLNRAISVILAVEVLRFVSHSMTGVTNDWDLYLGVVGHLLIFSVLVGGHGDLESCRHGLIIFSSSHITILQSRSHRVHIEEGVFSMLDISRRFSIQGLMSLVADCW